ncbi:MAG: hypothetical protein ACI9HK_000441, partial [Pirellulaceae bacterium]
MECNRVGRKLEKWIDVGYWQVILEDSPGSSAHNSR